MIALLGYKRVMQENILSDAWIRELLQPLQNEEIEYKLVTSEESDVATGKISTTSPIGRALLNKKVGDSATVVTPAGNREMEILNLVTIHDETEAEAKA